MRLVVIGASGAFPSAGQPCSGFLVEHENVRLLLDAGYGVATAMSQMVNVASLEAILISHSHPDHCADLGALLRERAFGAQAVRPLSIYALPGALDAVLRLDPAGMIDAATDLRPFDPGDRLQIGPFTVDTRLLPHSVPNVGFRLSAGGSTMAFTGDAGPSADLVAMARDVDLLVAEATYVDAVPHESRSSLSSARQAGAQARDARVGHLMLTHLWPGTDPAASQLAARVDFAGPVSVAASGTVVDIETQHRASG